MRSCGFQALPRFSCSLPPLLITVVVVIQSERIFHFSVAPGPDGILADKILSCRLSGRGVNGHHSAAAVNFLDRPPPGSAREPSTLFERDELQVFQFAVELGPVSVDDTVSRPPSPHEGIGHQPNYRHVDLAVVSAPQLHRYPRSAGRIRLESLPAPILHLLLYAAFPVDAIRPAVAFNGYPFIHLAPPRRGMWPGDRRYEA